MSRFLAILLMLIALPAGAQIYDQYGHALVQDAQGWVYVDKAGHAVVRPYIFDNGPDYFEEGLARFVENGKMGFHDNALNIVVPAKYDFVFPFKNGQAKAGTDCHKKQQGEHFSVLCEHWEIIKKPTQ